MHQSTFLTAPVSSSVPAVGHSINNASVWLRPGACGRCLVLVLSYPCLFSSTLGLANRPVCEIAVSGSFLSFYSLDRGIILILTRGTLWLRE